MISPHFQNILVYVHADAESSIAIGYAARFAEPGAAITVVAVVPEIPSYAHAVDPSPVHDWDEAHVREVRLRIERLAEPLKQSHHQVHIDVLRGRPHVETAKAVLRSAHDLVLKDCEESAAGAAPIDIRLIRKCPCPVWLARPRPSIRRVAVAIPPDESAESNPFNRLLLTYARDLAERSSAALHVVQSWELLGELKLQQHMTGGQFEQYRQAYFNRLDAQFHEFLETYGAGADPTTVHGIPGAPEDIIPRTVHQYDIDLLIIGTIARSGIKGHLLGNTAEDILHKLDTNVLVLKPEGWTSPITLD